jgi:hypothetical protein
MTTQTQQIIQDIPEWQRDLYFGNSEQFPGFQGLIPSAFDITQQQAAAGIPQRGVGEELDVNGRPLSHMAIDAARTSLGGYTDFLSSAQGGFGTSAQMLGQGANLIQSGIVPAVGQFPGAYNFLNQAAGGIHNALGQGQSGVTGAQGDAQFAINSMQQQDPRLAQMGQQYPGQIRGAVQPAAQQTNTAIDRARGIADRATNQLLSSNQQFNPNQTQGFMNPYTQQVVRAQQQEMQRLADIQRQDIRAQAVGQGAFGGSREALQQSELTRNLMDQQARLGAEMSHQGYTQAQNAAMSSFENAMQRQLSGAGTAGQIGLSAEDMASRSAQGMGQLGLSAEQIAAQTGMSVEQMRQQGYNMQGNLALGMGNLAIQGNNQQMAGSDLLRQLGLAQGQLAGQESDIYRQGGLGLGALANEMTALGGQQHNAAQLYSNLAGADIQRLLGLSAYTQGVDQNRQDINYANNMAQFGAGQNSLTWLSDIVNRVPGGYMGTTATSAQQPSAAQGLIGSGIAALGLAGVGNNSGGGGGFGFS